MAHPMFKPILPKKDPFKDLTTKLRLAQLEMNNFANAGLQALKVYPPPSGSKRSGDLSRHWKKGPVSMVSGRYHIEVFNDLPYAVYVQGPRSGGGKRQRRPARKYGWLSVTDVRKQIWPPYRDRIFQLIGARRTGAPIFRFGE